MIFFCLRVGIRKGRSQAFFSIYHNHLLQQAIADQLKEKHPDVIVVYGDYYNAFLWLLSKADLLGKSDLFASISLCDRTVNGSSHVLSFRKISSGFDPTSLQKACCGIGEDYNSGLSSWCGDPKVPVCENPNEQLSWDGAHLTQRAYEVMATWLVRGIYPKLQCEYIVSYSSAV
ncbi:hypothetical protein ES319_D13G006500v1 [Gossypium barbadense]|uniref:SGNH domain-containing protein n=1 Tax=Gossypium barbadense TaxID=3634 RepID=A0A5J5NFL5_GOSBA|nr:hypothetical protein ES319_D13G006500v1 [Gossypium barbadense]PPD72879.1 hypothetical protein GOBAR_DD30224 [Gossypium barbadense]